MNKKKVWIGVGALALVAVIFAAIYSVTKPAGNEFDKHITLEVVYGDGTSDRFDIDTNAENLREALTEQDLIAGTESSYGMFVESVNGVTADADKQEWWCLTKNQEIHNYGVDDTIIADGEQYEFTLTTGW